MEKSPHKLELLRRIAELEKKELWHLDVEDDPETYPLMPDKIDYLNDNLDYAIVTSDCRTSLPNQDVLDKYSSKLGKNGRVLCTSSFVTDEKIGEIVIKIRFDSKGLPILSDNTNSNNNDIE